MSPPFTHPQLDALRELGNIGSGTASTALSSMLGRAVDISVPKAEALPLADAVDAVGPGEDLVTAVVVGVVGEMDATVVLLFGDHDSETVCRLLGVEAGTEMGVSALAEVGNIVATSYIDALAMMSGLAMEPEPPQAATDMLGAVVTTVLAGRAAEDDLALVLDSQLAVGGEDCGLSFLLLPSGDGVSLLLERIGMGS